MFYLLEDNRIIDDKKMQVFVKERQNLLFLHRKERFQDVIGQIKLQSEDVYDLIDWREDLIETSGGIIFQLKFLKWYQIQDIIENGDITDIYKPNSNGDYIKVWKKY